MNFRKFNIPTLAAALLCASLGTIATAQSPRADNGTGTPHPIEKCWEYPTTELSRLAPASDTKAIYVSRSGGRVDAVSINTGSRLWSSELGGEPASNIVLGNDSAYIVTAPGASSDGALKSDVLRSLSLDTGITNWTARIPYAGQAFVGLNERNVVVVSDTGRVTAVDKSTGVLAWERTLHGGLSAQPRFERESIVLTTNDKAIVVISNHDGQERSRIDIPRRATTVMLDQSNNVVWGDERGNIYSHDLSGDERLWHLKSGAKISDVTEVADGLLITSYDNFVYLVTNSSGNIVWKRRQPGRVTDAPAVNDHFAVIVSYGDGTAKLIDQKTGRQLNQLTLSDGNNFLRSPVINEASIMFLTAQGVISFNQTGCSRK